MAPPGGSPPPCSGPILLEDYHLVEKLAQFDRERIPERVVHARGATAKGFFEVRVWGRAGECSAEDAAWGGGGCVCVCGGGLRAAAGGGGGTIRHPPPNVRHLYAHTHPRAGHVGRLVVDGDLYKAGWCVVCGRWWLMDGGWWMAPARCAP